MTISQRESSICMTTTRISHVRLVLLGSLLLSFLGCFISQKGRDAGNHTKPTTPVLVIPLVDGSSVAEHPTGAITHGGMDGRILRVTTLAASGEGSLRDALEAEGARLVVFEVGGVIDLAGRTLIVRQPHLTIAGQTAPDPGITLIRGGLIVETHDVIIQHLAVRPGNDGPSPWSPDAMGVRGAAARNVLFEHCSATWGVDENLSASGPADVSDPSLTAADITMRYCLVAEALSHSTHPKGEHSKGTLVHDGVRNVLIEGCVFAHNQERNPRLKGGAVATVRDSVMYNWGSAAVGLGAKGNVKMLTPAQVTLVGNTGIPGRDTRGRVFVKGLDPGGRAIVADNLLFPPLQLADDRVVVVESSLRSDPRAAAERALRRAGSRPARRDPIDARIIASVIAGDGKIIDSQNEVGGYPVRAATTRAVVVPADRQAWLARLSEELGEDRSLDLSQLWSRAMRQR